jgi:hypothetical protein
MAIRCGIVRRGPSGGKVLAAEQTPADAVVPNKLVRRNIGRTIMPLPTTDKAILGAIEKLTHEEHALYEKKGGLTAADKARLKKINVELDEAWDLLRQRRAKREFGQNPDEADLRPPKIVENYEG